MLGLFHLLTSNSIPISADKIIHSILLQTSIVLNLCSMYDLFQNC